MSRRLQNNARGARFSLVFPAALRERLFRRAAAETYRTKRQVTPSEVIRRAVEEYLSAQEGK